MDMFTGFMLGIATAAFILLVGWYSFGRQDGKRKN